jgi:D-erythrose 4-phosphate dehydrogenase
MNRPLRVAINGYGRIGRCLLRALHEASLTNEIQIVLINEPADLATLTYLTQFDSTHGVFPGRVEQDDRRLIINGTPIHVTHAKTPEEVNWSAYGLDMLIECSGVYSTRDQLQRFIDAGCPRVLVSQPARSARDVDYTLVYGVNQQGLTGKEILLSNASCTTNATVPVLAWLDQAYGLQHVFLTTLHSVMNDQPMIDGYHHTDLRRTRSAMQSIIPVSTGLAQGIERLLPQLAGKVQAKAIRVPVLNVSGIDIMLQFEHPVSQAELNRSLLDLANANQGLIDYSDRPHASVDFNHNPHSAIIDGSQTRCAHNGFANVFVWFDNEWGFANRMLDAALCWAAAVSTHQ